MPLEIRTFQPGDEQAQVGIYNSCAGSLPGFKPAVVEDVRRRTTASDFDPRMRFYAVADGKTVGYCAVQPNGRVGYPWCLPGNDVAEPLIAAAFNACRARGIKRIFTAYRVDWTTQAAFFKKHGFHKAREMVNFAQSILDLPTMVIRRGLNVTPFRREDAAAGASLAPGVIRIPAEKFADCLLTNPYFAADSIFVARRADNSPQGIGILINNPAYANPMLIDSAAPCFRLGAFGTEEMTAKRVNGLFSFLVRDDSDATAIGLDLLSYTLNRLQDESIDALAAQVPGDAKHLLGFYQKYFRKQGAFPVYERELN